MKKILIFLSLVVILNQSMVNVIAEDFDLTGPWQGKLMIPGQELRIVFNLKQDNNGQINATMDSPDQNATGIPVNDVSLNERDILISVKIIKGTYQGKIQNDNKSIQGTWEQNGYKFPLNLTKSDNTSKIAGPPNVVVERSDEKSFPASNETEIVLETPGGKLFGTLTVPEVVPPFPVAFIIAGSGPTDRDGNNPAMKNNSLKMLATELSNKGIASLRYDKRGIGQSATANIKNLNFETYIKDAAGWIDLLKQDHRFNKLIVIGHSEGSLIGMIASQPKNVTKFISIAGAGQTADKLLGIQLKAQSTELYEQALPLLEKLNKGESVDNVPPMLNQIFNKVNQPYLISWFKHDPQKEIAKLKIPVLVIQGTTDIQICLDDAEKLAIANPNAKQVIIDGMNHIMKAAEADPQKNIQTYNDPELPLKPELVTAIVDFIK